MYPNALLVWCELHVGSILHPLISVWLRQHYVSMFCDTSTLPVDPWDARESPPARVANAACNTPTHPRWHKAVTVAHLIATHI